MPDDYSYRAFRLGAPRWEQAGDDLRAAGQGVLAVFRGEIGVGSDEGVVLSVGQGELAAVTDVDAAASEALQRTLRPESPEPLTAPGVYAHRRFEVAEGDWEEFLALSAAAWPDFEAVNDGCRIIGLWRVSGGPSPGLAEALLITRYPSLAAWEKSRPYASQPVDDDKLDAWIAARDAFRRRAELTRRTIVRTYRLV